MNKRMMTACLCVLGLQSFLASAATVVFNDAALLTEVKAQWEAQTGGVLSDPPLDTELANTAFNTLLAPGLGIADLTGLEACASLTKLDLSMNSVSDVTPISALTGLTYLDLGCGDIDDAATDLFAAGTNLLDNADVAIIAGLTGLRYLNLEGNTGISNIASLASLSSLQTFWFGASTAITSFTALASMSDLKRLGLVDCGFKDTSDSNISGLTGLETLYLVDQIHLTNISTLSTLVNLKQANFKGSPITSFAACANWTGLVDINISNGQATDLDAFSGLTSLERLIASGTELSDISGLADHSSLAILDLSYGLKVTDISALENDSALEYLNLCRCPVVDISALLNDTALSYVNLNGCAVTDISALANNTGLGGTDTVDIRKNPLSYTARCEQLATLSAKLAAEGTLLTNAACGPELLMTTNAPDDANVFPEVGSSSYPEGTAVSLLGKPAVNSLMAFQEWTGDLVSENYEETLVMDADKTVQAVFATGDHKLHLSAVGDGSIIPFGASGFISFLDGRVVTLTAMPFNSASFTGWTGSVVSTEPTIEVTMDADKTVVAHFGASTARTLTILEPDGNGSTNLSPGAHICSGTVSLFASPDAGWQFAGWLGDIGDADPSNPHIDLTMDQDRTVQATYTQIMWDLTVSIVGNGTLNVTPDEAHPTPRRQHFHTRGNPGSRLAL